jgi:hypothetical protein
MHSKRIRARWAIGALAGAGLVAGCGGGGGADALAVRIASDTSGLDAALTDATPGQVGWDGPPIQAVQNGELCIWVWHGGSALTASSAPGATAASARWATTVPMRRCRWR